MSILPSIILTLICGALKGNADRLEYHPSDNRWMLWDSVLSRFMQKGSDARVVIPKWLPLIVRSAIRGWFDGRHVSRSMMYILLIVVYPFTIYDGCQVTLNLLAFAAGFFAVYHMILPVKSRE